MRTVAGAVLVLCVAGLTAGCGEQRDEATSAATSAATEAASLELPTPSRLPKTSTSRRVPSCRALWADGKTLPQHYDGCMDEASEARVAAMGYECSDGSRLVNFRGRQWAMTGGPVSLTEGSTLKADAGYLEAVKACAPS